MIIRCRKTRGAVACLIGYRNAITGEPKPIYTGVTWEIDYERMLRIFEPQRECALKILNTIL